MEKLRRPSKSLLKICLRKSTGTVRETRGTCVLLTENRSRAAPEQVLCSIRNPWLRGEDLRDPRTQEERVVIRDPFTARRSLARNRQCAVIFVGDSAILETLICRGYRGGERGTQRLEDQAEKEGLMDCVYREREDRGFCPLDPLDELPSTRAARLCTSLLLCLSNVFRLADPISRPCFFLLLALNVISLFSTQFRRNFRFDEKAYQFQNFETKSKTSLQRVCF